MRMAKNMHLHASESIITTVVDNHYCGGTICVLWWIITTCGGLLCLQWWQF